MSPELTDYSAPICDVSETRMNVGIPDGCWSRSSCWWRSWPVRPRLRHPSPTSPPTPASTSTIDYVALEAEIEKAITTGPVTLDNVRAMLVSVDADTKIARYRHGFTEDDHAHVFSVTKSALDSDRDRDRRRYDRRHRPAPQRIAAEAS